MSKSVVALVSCGTYDEAQVASAIETGIELLGGAARFFRPNEKIVMKPNILLGTDPRKCVTTHPSVFRAVGKLLKKAKATVYYGDSPSLGKCEWHVKRANLKQVADDLGIKLADFDHGATISHKDALLNKRFVIADGILEADGVVNLSKLKTHPLTRLTGAVKNQFGCIPGTLKSEYHVKMPDPIDFATMLVDLNTLIKARLYIMDGIMAMEGNGPRGGKPRKLGVLLFSSDPVALDSVACKIIDINPEFVPTSKPGEKSGLGTYHYENIEIVGASIEPLVCRDFEVIRKPSIPYPSGRLRTFIKNRICPRPAIDETKCNNCGTCISLCPVDPKAVNWHKGDESKPPVYKYDSCIRCYCCQESCPEGAVSVENTCLGRIFFPAQ